MLTTSLFSLQLKSIRLIVLITINKWNGRLNDQYPVDTQRFVPFPWITQRVFIISLATIRFSSRVICLAAILSSPFLIYPVLRNMVFITPLFLPLPRFNSRPSEIPTFAIFEKAAVGSQCGTMVGKTHLVDLHRAWSAAALIRSRPWLGMHIPWSASTPLGASMSSRVRSSMRRLHPIFGF